MRRRQALTYRLALSTSPGAPNQPAGGGAGGSFTVSGPFLVTDDTGQNVALTSSAYQAILGDTITIRYDAPVRLWQTNPRSAGGTISPNIRLTEF